MSFASKHNRGGINWELNTEGFQYLKLEDLYKRNPKTVHILRGLYINKKSIYGYSPVGMLDTCFVNLPDHLLQDVEDILTTTEDVEAIKAGKVGFVVEEYISRNPKAKGRTCYGLRWVDIQEPEKAEITFD